MGGAGRRFSDRGDVRSPWYERLSFEATVLEPTPVCVPVPVGASAAVVTVAEHVALYVGLRAASEGGWGPEKPFTFTQRFASAYCRRVRQAGARGDAGFGGVRARSGARVRRCRSVGTRRSCGRSEGRRDGEVLLASVERLARTSEGR